MGKENVIIGTLVLSASSIFVRLIGFVFRIWLSDALGAEGMGVYTLIMTLYGLCATLATSGISAGVSRLAAAEFAQGKTENARRVLIRAISLSLVLSITVGIALFVFAGSISEYILNDTRTLMSLKLLAPGLPFMAVSACLRGYFIARRKMGNPAASQVLEQLLKMAFIMMLIGYWLPRGIEYGCAVVIAGITFGEVVCFLISWAGYATDKLRDRKNASPDIQSVTAKLLAFAIPISIGSYVRSGLRLVEDVLILNGFKQFSGNDDTATGTYGMLRGMVMPLLVFPLGLLSAFVVTLTPEMSRMQSTRNEKSLSAAISRILQITCIIGIFIVSVFMAFSGEIGMAVYKSVEVGEMLKSMAFLCPVMCVEMVVVSILQGLGEQVSSLRYNIVDCILRVVLVFLLVPRYGVQGFVGMVIVSNLFTSLLNLRRLLKITSVKMNINDWIIKPALAAATATQLIRVVMQHHLLDALPQWVMLCTGVILIGLIYAAVLFSVGSITTDDVKWLRRQGSRVKAAGRA